MSSAKTISNTFSVNTIEDGLSAASLELSQTTILYDANSNGISTQQQSFAITYALKVNGNVCSNVTANIVAPTNVTISNKTASGCTVTCANNASINGIVKITLYGTYNEEQYSATAGIVIEPNKKGEQGERGQDGTKGDIGRFFYYGGEWDRNNPTPFPITNAQAPFFKHIEEGMVRYHVFNPNDNPTTGSMTMAEMWAASNEQWNNYPWQSMTNDFKYLITEAIFSNFAHLGGAIISGDWMISQYGTINGQTSQNFQAFDSQHPNDNVVTNFIPNFCVNLNTGDSYQQNAYIAGSLFTDSVRTKFVTIPNNCRRLYVGLSQEQVDLYDPYPYPQSRYIHMGYDDAWNFLLPSNSEIEVILCMNSNALHGQRVLLYNSHAITAGGTASATILRSCEVLLMYDEHDDEHYVEWSYYPFRGVVTNENASQGNEYEPSQIDTYDPVYTIVFVNGVVEIMCVPRKNDNLHDWCVINIGSNCFALNPLRT